ncbi:MAG: site-specific DNA-methyltransferase [Chlorobi bacterium]|nr:site-specific DNA-methyltransferase [Chlorobiota bacterium]
MLTLIPYFFLNNNIFSKKGDKILDPFCGSGTVLLEAQIASRYSFGIDSNPLARLITKVKTETYKIRLLEEYKKKILKNYKSIQINEHDFVEFDNIDFWYSKRIKRELTKILFSINQINNDKYKNFFLVCFSNCVRKVSFADPKISVPVKLDLERYDARTKFYKKIEKRVNYVKKVRVIKKYEEIMNNNIDRMAEKNEIVNRNYKSFLISDDVRNFVNHESKKSMVGKIEKESMNLIITSPPYAGAQKYIRASKLNLSWLGIAQNGTLKNLDQMTIGRENYQTDAYKELLETNIEAADRLLKKIHKLNPLRAHIAANYLNEMRNALNEIVNALKTGGYLVLIIGNNNLCGYEFKTHNYLTYILEDLGLKVIFKLVDDIKSYGLMTKRNKTADIINREWVLVFEK